MGPLWPDRFASTMPHTYRAEQARRRGVWGGWSSLIAETRDREEIVASMAGCAPILVLSRPGAAALPQIITRRCREPGMELAAEPDSSGDGERSESDAGVRA